MTSQSSRNSQRNAEIENGVVVVSSTSSSEDEDETILRAFSYDQGSSNDRRTIRELVREGKRLLMLAEVKSRPEDYRSDATAVYRYNFSSAVTGCDLFRDRELVELLNCAAALKMRLSAERVFSLGCPQLRSERDVFDELLMRFSDELLDITHSTHTNEIGEEAISVSEPVESLPVVPTQSSSSNIDSRTATSAVTNPPYSLTQSLSNMVFHSSVNQLERYVNDPQNGLHSRGSLQENAEVASNSTHPESIQVLQDICSALREFLQSVSEPNSLTNQSHQVVSDTSLTPIPVRIVQALHTSLASIMKTSSTDSSQLAAASLRVGKRRRSEDANTDMEKKSKIKVDCNEKDDDKDEDSCSICLEPWSTGGDHRVTCLKCGHLFGLSCILKWVEQAHCCPQCKTAAKKSDLRHIFVAKVTAEDTSQRDRAMRLLEEEKIARRNLEQKEAMARKKLEMQASDIEALRSELMQLKAQQPESGKYLQSQIAAVPKATSSVSSSQFASNKRFNLFQRLNISPDGNCRVFDQCQECGLLVVSQKASNSLFRGFGIKILTRDFRPLSYQPLHSAAIRDMSFRPGAFDSTLLSCGLDKCLQLTSVRNQAVIHKYNVNNSVWCCAWNTQNTNLFYAGMEKGIVKEFDIRRTDSHVQDLLDYGGSPITSIQYWKGQLGEDSLHGLLIAHLQSLIFGEQTNDQLVTHRLPHQQASLMSLSLHPSGVYLSSFRPGSQFPKCRYEMSNLCLSNIEDLPRSVSSSCQAVWEGSNNQAVISRNSLISRPESQDGLLAVTANHSSNTVSVWDCNKRKEFQTLPTFDKAIDIKLLSGDMLGVLTDKELLLYNWRV